MKLRGVSGLAQPTLLNFPPGRTPHSYSIRDQATSSLHELAHTKGVFDPETYGYDTVYQLSSGSALENAESYAFFAKYKLCTSFAKESFLIWTIAAFLNCQVSN